MPIRPTKKGMKVYKRYIKPTIKRLRKDVNKIKSSIELKHHDSALSGNFGNDTSLVCLTDMAQGDTSSAKTGLKVTAKKLLFNVQVQWKTTATQENHCRIIIFKDKATNGVNPTLANLLESSDTTSFYNNIYEGKRFVVLRDKVIQNRNVTTAVAKYEQHNFKIKMSHNLWYLTSSTGTASRGAGHVYLAVIANVPNADADAPAYNWDSRFYYTDL